VVVVHAEALCVPAGVVPELLRVGVLLLRVRGLLRLLLPLLREAAGRREGAGRGLPAAAGVSCEYEYRLSAPCEHFLAIWTG